ncbi:MAG: type II toxin-antitoxin system RelE/ParE family toxin [Bacteroidales bacterium]|nr:type II toxin-antitoxin system RelE/ParE family toxin [Bacteroidales bacterium]
MVKLNWTPISISDIKAIFDFIAEDSTRYAQITVNKIYFRVQLLIDQPYLGRIVPEIDKKSLREIISGNYRIIYRIVNEYQVDILRIYHSSRNLDNDSLK